MKPPGEGIMDQVDEEQGVEIRKTICWPSPGCHCNCGLLVRVKDNKILSIKGNPDFPYNRGAVCGERMPHFASGWTIPISSCIR